MQFSFDPNYQETHSNLSPLLKRFVSISFYLTLIFVWVCSISAQSQSTEITWTNLQEKYESFYEIKPQIINSGPGIIYFDSYYFPFVHFEWYSKKLNSWVASDVWQCGTGYKPAIQKIKPMEFVNILIPKLEWNEIILEDSIGIPKFKKYPEYDGTGRYRFYFRYGLQKSKINLVSYSPEFEVAEKDFVR